MDSEKFKRSIRIDTINVLTSCNNIKPFDFSILYSYSPLLTKRQIERISSTLFHKNVHMNRGTDQLEGEYNLVSIGMSTVLLKNT
jgi:hypothetical protein